MQSHNDEQKPPNDLEIAGQLDKLNEKTESILNFSIKQFRTRIFRFDIHMDLSSYNSMNKILQTFQNLKDTFKNKNESKLIKKECFNLLAYFLVDITN